MFGLFNRESRAWRCYVRLDGEGRCLSIWKFQKPPLGKGWLAVDGSDRVRIGEPPPRPADDRADTHA